MCSLLMRSWQRPGSVANCTIAKYQNMKAHDGKFENISLDGEMVEKLKGYFRQVRQCCSPPREEAEHQIPHQSFFDPQGS